MSASTATYNLKPERKGLSVDPLKATFEENGEAVFLCQASKKTKYSFSITDNRNGEVLQCIPNHDRKNKWFNLDFCIDGNETPLFQLKRKAHFLEILGRSYIHVNEKEYLVEKCEVSKGSYAIQPFFVFLLAYRTDGSVLKVQYHSRLWEWISIATGYLLYLNKDYGS